MTKFEWFPFAPRAHVLTQSHHRPMPKRLRKYWSDSARLVVKSDVVRLAYFDLDRLKYALKVNNKKIAWQEILSSIFDPCCGCANYRRRFE